MSSAFAAHTRNGHLRTERFAAGSVRAIVVAVTASLAELRASWDRLGLSVDDLRPATDGTLASPHAATLASEPGREVSLSGPVTTPLADSREVELAELLGEGGMGRVWSATQRVLEREVAVKGLREDLDTPLMRSRLLLEARVTGRLEHPNVVPVHLVTEDDEGRPRIVLKRIEGRSWRELLDERPADGRDLAEQVRILGQVCQAIRFAHSRGVLHRDLKPENVMVGDFGEVYVVDWGIALALHERTGVVGLPLARETREIVGTLPYMAPEMAAGDGTAFGVTTDVYQLGALLHEVLVGEPPHVGSELVQVLHHAYLSPPPTYSDAVPTELAQLATKAMEREPKRRPRDAEAFRAALDAWSVHRASNELVDESRRRARLATGLVELGEDPLPAWRDARFGYLQALRIWPDNERAHAGLREVLELLLERAIASEAVELARELLNDLSSEDDRARWAPQVDALAKRKRDERERLAKLEAEKHDTDLAVAARSRRVFGVGFALLFLVVNVALDFVERGRGLVWWHYLVATAATAGLFAGPALLRRKQLFPNRASRRLAWSLASMLVGQALTFAALSFVGVGLRPALATSLMPLATAIGVKSVLVDPRMNWAAFLSVIGGVLALFVPTTAFAVVGVVYAAFFGAGALLPYELDLAPDMDD